MAHDYEDIFDLEDLDEDELRQLVREVLRDYPSIDPDGINIHVQGSKVILTGRIGTDAEKRIAERIVGDRIGVQRVESQLLVDPLYRSLNPEGADESVAFEEDTEMTVSGQTLPQRSDTDRNMATDPEAAYTGTTDRQQAIEDGVPWIPPESPTPEGTDEVGPLGNTPSDSF